MHFRLIVLALLAAALSPAQVAVVVPPAADSIQKLAASELAAYLTRLYPTEKFSVTFATQAGDAEAFSIKASGGHVVIASGSSRGALFAVYALLEKLGCGFYLSYQTLPPGRQGKLNFAEWNFADAPLFHDRLVFDWHNFLSSASTWEFDDWQHYIDRSVRMRFNDLMVHAYGNNPMFTFRFAGLSKPVGFLATTRTGRDWGTQHVNDVRKMIGGRLFDGPAFGAGIFGASIATADPDRRAPATLDLMQRVFAHAAARGMKITFALDVDTESANPQELIATLPASARFAVHGFQLVNPETAEGYAYYRSEIQQLLDDYPQITRLAIWFRGGRNSPWRELTRADFPAAWREPYDRALAKSHLRADPEAPSLFAIGKLATAFRAILDETGHGSVALAAGSWRFDFLRSADAFLPAGIALLPLDYDYAFPSDPAQEAIAAVSSHRPVVPVVWAQHDDREFAGRPYLPFTGFASLLRRTNSQGFGIIHWTTRPLDLYFKSLAQQVWEKSENEPLSDTCRQMAERTFGAAAEEPGTQYLLAWIKDAPAFGRETSDQMIHLKVDEVPVVEGCRRRLQMLKSIGALAKSPQASGWVSYFEDWERYAMEFHQTQAAWQRAVAALGRGDCGQARSELEKARPETAIAQYARTIAHGDATRGELGILVSLNLRWLPYVVSTRQAAGMEPVRIRIGTVDQEPLAQGAGHNSFFFDDQGRLWRVLDRAALAGKLRTGAIMGDRLQPGRYSVNGGPAQEARDGQVEVEIRDSTEAVVIGKVQ